MSQAKNLDPSNSIDSIRRNDQGKVVLDPYGASNTINDRILEEDNPTIAKSGFKKSRQSITNARTEVNQPAQMPVSDLPSSRHTNISKATSRGSRDIRSPPVVSIYISSNLNSQLSRSKL